MTRTRLTAVLTAFLIMPAGFTAIAQQPAAESSVVNAAREERAEKDEEALVCTRTRQTGSNRVTRVCRTAEEARVERRAAEEAMRRKKSQPARPDQS